MERRAALTIAAVTAAITLTGAAAVALNVGLLAPRTTEPAGALQPAAQVEKKQQAKKRPATVIVRPKERTQVEPETVVVRRSVPSPSSGGQSMTAGMPAPAAAEPDGYPDDDAYEPEDDDGDEGAEDDGDDGPDEDGPEVDEDGPEVDEDGPEVEEEEHEGAEDDD